MFAIGIHIHDLPETQMPADMSGDRTFILLEISPHQGNVAAMDRVLEELVGQVHGRLVVFGYHQQSAGVLVDPVYQSVAWQFIVRQVRLLLLQVPGDAIDQGTGIISMSRVDDHARRLVDHHDVIVFENNVQRHLLRLDIEGLRGVV